MASPLDGPSPSAQSAEGSATAERRGVIVPAAAVRDREGRDVVFVVKERRAERRAVSVAEERGDDAELASGLSAGERVVVEGPAELQDGDRVEEEEP